MSNSLRLGDLVAIERGSTYKSALVGRPGPVLLGLASIGRNGGFRSGSLRTYGGDSPDRMLVRPGQLYASLKDLTQAADLLGSVARLPVDSPVGRLTQDTVRLDLVSEAVTADYVYWCLRTPQYRAYCRAHATGTTNLGLPRDDFLDFEIPEPTPWRLILVEAIGAIDDLIDINRRLARQLDSRLVASWLALARRCHTERALGELVDPRKGVSYKGAFLAEHGLPLINLANFALDGSFKESGTKHYLGPVKDRQLLSKGSLVVANTDLTQRCEILARPLLVPFEAATSTHHTFQLDVRGNDALRGWIFCALRTKVIRRRLISFATGTTVAALPVDALLSQKIPLASDQVIDGWWSKASALRKAQESVAAETHELVHTRDEVLPLLMSGRVRVEDVPV